MLSRYIICNFMACFGGIGLSFDTKVPFHPGQELEVHHNGVRVFGIVRHFSVSDNGCSRVGLEWNAFNLAQTARKRIALSGKEDVLHPFRECLPSGFYMMWKLLENENWIELAETANRLKKLAAKCEVPTLCSFVRELQEAAQSAAPRETSVVALHAMVQECLRLATDPAANDELSMKLDLLARP